MGNKIILLAIAMLLGCLGIYGIFLTKPTLKDIASMNSKYLMNSKFLSHRLIGFDSAEHTLKAMENAIEANIPYLEIDIRFSKDREAYVLHDDIVEINGESISITSSTSSEIDDFIKKHDLKLEKLEILLEKFAQRKYQEQKLMIDIKDFGFEQDCYNMVKKYALLEGVIWVSWIPQTLIELHRIDPTIPKILSYVPIHRSLEFVTNIFAVKKIPFYPIVLIGDQHYNSPLEDKTVGFQHGYLSSKLNSELIDVLSSSGGGVCVHKSLISQTLLDFNEKNGLITAVFSAKNRSEYDELAQSGIDIIFNDFIDSKVHSYD